MPEQLLAQSNPPPEPSHLPKELASLKVELDYKNALSAQELNAIELFCKAGDFLAASMLFLKSNTLLERKVTKEDVKRRILGHWGTDPGLVLVYAHCTLLTKKKNLQTFFVTGPGHGAPGILACLWLEGSLGHFYPQYSLDKRGAQNLCAGFSAPGGLPRYVFLLILIALAHHIAVTSMPKPLDPSTKVVNSDMHSLLHSVQSWITQTLSSQLSLEMESQKLALLPRTLSFLYTDSRGLTIYSAWHGYKFVDPAESGAILPIIHVNGFKISNRTIYGTMDDLELATMFT